MAEADVSSNAEEKALREIERASADLQKAQDELQKATADLEAARKKHLVTIIVDDESHQVRAGSWLVKDLKAALGIDQAKILAEITPQGLKDLADDQTIELHEGEKFMTHARSGGAS